ncbi:ahpC/TSA family protein [Spiroplasma sabaudiense Ar-1343]|uniref:thioredoxin-dependent peroxiredoxin n=1 Tax=Spiroplasma sabaudiense Ar-1343 TaxID=1276257 RepID=W6ABV4_9MOLU|nr:peroxiredoxin [Spiroplasma sabaudiense]AHI54320.1 ahpC/TSA family protein [Spiroplasma sabaudiense Ar-1343]
MNWKTKKYMLENSESKMLSELTGQKGLVLFFYPVANADHCAMELKAYEKKAMAINDKGYNVVGVSRDSVPEQEKFAKSCMINFSLISDSDLTLHNEFKVITSTEPAEEDRSTFILDNNLNVLHELRSVDTSSHIDEVIMKL